MSGASRSVDRVGEDLSPTLVIRNAALLDRPGGWDILVSGGTVTGVDAAGSVLSAGCEELDAHGGLVTRSFVEPHFHPDKALTRPRVGPQAGSEPDGGSDSIEAKMARGAAVKAAFSFADIKARAGAALSLAVSHGIGAMRAQVDVDTVSGLTGMAALLELRSDFTGLIDLQLVAFPQEGVLRDPGALGLVAEALKMGADLVGGGPNNEDAVADWRPHVRSLLELARRAGVRADFHVDFREDPAQRALELVAEETVRAGMCGRVNVSHCCALAAYPDAHAARVVERVRAAGIQVCICPMSNLLAPTGSRTEHGRGSSRPKELLDAGVNVAAGSDNLHDMWFRFGRLDPVQLGLITCLAAGMRTDDEVRDAFAMTTSRAATYAGVPAAGPEPGAKADLVIFSATTLDDVLRGVAGERRTLKHGRLVGGCESRTWLAPAVSGAQALASST